MSRRRRWWILAAFGLGAATTLLASTFVVRKTTPPAGTWGSEIEQRFGLQSDFFVQRDWQLVEGKHWQITSPDGEDIRVTDAREGTRGACPEGMVHVRGRARQSPTGVNTITDLELLQNQTCSEWISKDFPARCAKFDRDKWLGIAAILPRVEMNFCIDRFEFPNVKGQYPVIMVTFQEASSLCAKRGKRLCTETEWTFACEGEEAQPYPYGYERDSNACVTDRPWRAFDDQALLARSSERARDEVEKLWQGEQSGSRPRCRSPFGVYDMTGNVDEWTRSVRATGFASILKGGYWGPIRARCQPSTRAHDEGFVSYQQSFRCCAGVPGDSQPAAAVDAPQPDTELASRQAAIQPAPPVPASVVEIKASDENRDERVFARGQRACSAAPAPANQGAWATLMALSMALGWRRSRVTGATVSRTSLTCRNGHPS